MASFRSPVWISPEEACEFPDPRQFHPQGLIAGGADLSAERLLAAYRAGIFPWYDELPILWWSPDPRAVINPHTLHISRSLKRKMQRSSFVVTCNQAPEEVMRGCAARPEGTWLNPQMMAAYLRLFEEGHLVSFEVWEANSIADASPHLVGGLYGVLVDGLFAAESKFHQKTDASKIALVCAVTVLFEAGVSLFDVQFLTEHLSSLGVYTVSRAWYIEELARTLSAQVKLPDSRVNLLPTVLERLG